MSLEQIRLFASGYGGAIVSAVVGAFIFRWLTRKWSRWIPIKVGTKGRATLLKEHEIAIWIAKALSIAGMGLGWLCYYERWLSVHDWRGLGLGAGLMAGLPIAYIVAANATRGTEAIKECMVAYAISEKTPTGLFIGVITFCLIGGFVSAISLILRS